MCLALTVFSPCKGMSTDTLALDKAKDSISVTGKMPYEAVEDSVAKIMSAVDSANLSRTIIEDSLAKKDTQGETRLEHMAPKRKTCNVAGDSDTRSRTNIQPQILEGADCVRRLLGLPLRNKVEQPNVPRLFAGIHRHHG